MFDVSGATSFPGDRRLTRRTASGREFILITIETAPGEFDTIEGCIKDISGHGLGFVHQEELLAGNVSVMLTLKGEQVCLPIDVRWSKRLSSNWLCSGGFFIGEWLSRGCVERIRDTHVLAIIPG